MKPILYESDETDFTTPGLGVLTDELLTLVTEERNGQFYLEMEYPINGTQFKELKNDRIIKAHASNNLKNQRFKIVRITKPARGVVKVYAEHVSNHTSDMQLKPNVSYSGTASQALNTWNNNIVDSHPFTVYSDITTTGSGEWTLEEVRNARQALGGIRGSMLDTYGGEYRFDNYHISLLKQRGSDNGLPIMYGKNLIDLEQEEEITNTYTSIFPYSVYTPEGEVGQEGEIEPVEVTLPEYFVDSEHVDKYSRRKILKVNFTDEDIRSVEALRSRAQRYIIENDIGVPKVNLRVKFIDLAKTLDYKDTAVAEEINLCDWVVVYFEKIGIQQRAKVIKTVWNVGLERYEEIEVGEVRSSLSQSIDDVVDEKIEKVEAHINSKVSNDDFTSHINQIANNINLRVEKDDIINQINISDESILIESAKILLDGDVTVRGTAWMDGAVIKDLSVEGAKIASLDVDKLSGNKTEFVQSVWNSISSSLTINSRGLMIDSVDSWDMALVNHGVEITNKHGAATGLFTALVNSVTREPFSLGVVAENGFDAILGYRGNNSIEENLWSSAIRVDGTTGDTSLQNNLKITGESITMAWQTIYPSWVSDDSFYITTAPDGGISIVNRKSWTGIDLVNSGEVRISVATGQVSRLVVTEIQPYPSAHTSIKIWHDKVNKNEGIWLRDHTESSGIFMAKNGELHVRVGGKNYDMRTVLQNSGFPDA